jgi:MinD-like ATPase involved in chromosome partitioning or flagellar assembly
VATVTFVSAKGSPGASTLAVALALSWAPMLPGRSALAVDADPAGGDFAAGILGGAVQPSAGMLPLATSRGVVSAEAVSRATVHLRRDGTAGLIPGVPDSTRSAALSLAWDALVDARGHLDESRTDLLVDGGRVDLLGPISPWLTDTDLVLLVVRPTLPAVAAAHRFVANWSTPGARTSATPLEAVIVAAPSPYPAGEVAAAVGVPCRAVIEFDPAAARVHSEGEAPPRGFGRSGYVRSVEGLAAGLGARLGAPTERGRGAPTERGHGAPTEQGRGAPTEQGRGAPTEQGRGAGNGQRTGEGPDTSPGFRVSSGLGGG